MKPATTNEPDPHALALRALAATLADAARAERLLATTGLDPAGLGRRLDDPAALAAVLRFLEAYEPDLVAVAEAIEVGPALLVAARRALEQ